MTTPTAEATPTTVQETTQAAAPAATATPVAAAAATPAAAGAPMKTPGPSASLYVGDLDRNVTEGILYETFSAVGPVASIRVCRDSKTKQSLGYAYVNYQTVDDAERALDAMNNTLINGKPCRIMWCQRDPAMRKSGIGNIFIKDLDETIDHHALQDTFSAFGNILSCKVQLDENGKSKGFGFVHFEKAEAAEKAIKTVNGMVLGSKKVFVGPFLPQRERAAMKEKSWTNVYVKDLDPAIGDDELKAAFEKYGTITSCVVMKDDDGKSRGFGFINFEKHDDAVRASEEMNGQKLGEKEIYAGRAQKKREREKELHRKREEFKANRMSKYHGINIYIKFLEDDIDEERLRQEFSPFGTIKSVKVMRDEEKGVSRGFGFVCFTTPEEAQRAIQEMNGRILANTTKPLYVVLHEPKEVRRKKLSERHSQRSGMRGHVLGQHHMYPPHGGAVFYPGGAPQGFIYPQRMMAPPGRWPQGAGQPAPFQMGPNYMMHSGVRGAPAPMRGGRGGGAPVAAGRGGNRAARRTGPVPAAAQPVPVTALTPEQFAKLDLSQQRVYVGERLYPFIHAKQPALAGKITGMLLDSGWDMDELNALVDDEELLSTKIEEAVQALNLAMNKGPQEEGAAETPATEEAAAAAE